MLLRLANAGACADPRILADLAQLAEDAGWDAIFVEDYITHHEARDIPTCDPWIALAAMAPRTRRVRLGVSVVPLSRRRPWKVAREAVALDQLSSGRLILGVGLGDGNDISFNGVGEITDARQRAEMLDEALDIIVGLWGGQLFSYERQALPGARSHLPAHAGAAAQDPNLGGRRLAAQRANAARSPLGW